MLQRHHNELFAAVKNSGICTRCCYKQICVASFTHSAQNSDLRLTSINSNKNQLLISISADGSRRCFIYLRRNFISNLKRVYVSQTVWLWTTVSGKTTTLRSRLRQFAVDIQVSQQRFMFQQDGGQSWRTSWQWPCDNRASIDQTFTIQYNPICRAVQRELKLIFDNQLPFVTKRNQFNSNVKSFWVKIVPLVDREVTERQTSQRSVDWVFANSNTRQPPSLIDLQPKKYTTLWLMEGCSMDHTLDVWHDSLTRVSIQMFLVSCHRYNWWS